MEIINKSHAEIMSNERVSLDAFFKIEIGGKVVYFSAGAVSKFGIIPGIKVNFINDDNDWLFYCDNNNDGFPVLARSGKNSSIICDAHLAKLFLKRTQTSEGTKFLITLTKSEINSCPIFKIELNKPLQ